MRYTIPLADPQATLESTGGKGASLARLLAAGLPVPDGFHITTEAYQKIIEENNLQPAILAALQEVDVHQPETLEEAAKKISDLFALCLIPTEIAESIEYAYSALPGQQPTVAVRSSATAEDLPEASFAGQQETFLNVRGTNSLLEATKKCWASLWTARAIGYRAMRDISPNGVSLAVVVQLMAPAQAAGIMFTVDPVSGARDKMVINAAWGLGEAVVGGLVTPDTLKVDKVELAVVEKGNCGKASDDRAIRSRNGREAGTGSIAFGADFEQWSGARAGAPGLANRRALRRAHGRGMGAGGG